MTNFKDLNLNSVILASLEKKGYTNPTPIQQQAIPPIIERRDILGIAQTGTGKTAAFSLPILHNLAHKKSAPKSGGMRVLVLTPTRELALQIAENIELYGKDLGLRYAVVFGGVNERPQINAIAPGVDILIATPGRLLDLSERGFVRYMQLEVLVLDEADRMLDMGFINDIKKIIKKIPDRRQTLFFSATMPESISSLANSILKDPVRVEVQPAATTVERINQKVIFVEKAQKSFLLKKLLNGEGITSAIVFCATKHGSNRLVDFLERNGISCDAIHGDKSQNARQRALEDFRERKIKVLVATDIAARGIDIPAISHVFNYDIPRDPESYVHRIGRTARAGRDGIAISFCDDAEKEYLREIEKITKQKIPTSGGNSSTEFAEEVQREKSLKSREPRRNRDSSRRGGESKSRSFFGENRNRDSDSDTKRRDRFSRDGEKRSSAPRDRNDDRRTSSPRDRDGERRTSPSRDSSQKKSDKKFDGSKSRYAKASAKQPKPGTKSRFSFSKLFGFKK